MKSNNIFKIIAIVVSVAAVVTAIIVFRKQICDACAKVKAFVLDKFNKFNKPTEFNDFADI